MKVLIILISKIFEINHLKYCKTTYEKMFLPLINDGVFVDIAIIYSEKDINSEKLYEKLFGNVKYKYLSPNLQFNKMCDFLNQLNERYDWYIKSRPEIEMLENFDLQKLEQCFSNSINSRFYKLNLKNSNIDRKSIINNTYNLIELYNDILNNKIELYIDDQIYIFDDKVRDIAFKKINNEELYNLNLNNRKREDEVFHTLMFINRNVKLQTINIKANMLKYVEIDGNPGIWEPRIR